VVIYTVNIGSSSVRLAAYRASAGGCTLIAGRHQRSEVTAPDLLETFEREAGARPDAVIHRFVHGGALFDRTCELDAAAEVALRSLAALAPLHLPRSLTWLSAARARWPAAQTLAAFDTAFFHRLPAVAATYALPAELTRTHGLRRYGFHGLAHQSMWRALCQARPETHRAITFQLGSGCSVAAIRDGAPLETSMGFTPMEGLVMATRAGDVDAGILLHLLATTSMSPGDLEQMLNERSGLRGLCGDADMQALLARQDGEAELAVAIFCHRARKYLGAYLAVTGGADAIVFGGGVGENAAKVRARICAGFDWCGLRLESAANERRDPAPHRISAADSAIEAWVVPVDEQAVLAAEAIAFLETTDDARRKHAHGS
jgi:acetate kinase